MMHSNDEDIELCPIDRFGSIELFATKHKNNQKIPKILEMAGRSDQIAIPIGSSRDREKKDRSNDRDPARSILFFENIYMISSIY
jgi:hypothetical protein